MIPNSRIVMTAGPYEFAGTLELKAAPVAVAWLIGQLPLRGTVQQAAWSGDAGWVPLGEGLRLEPENATTHPSPGQILLYAGSKSQAELLIPYGTCAFACKAGSLAGSPVITLDNPLEQLRALGELLIAKGMQPLKLDWLSATKAVNPGG
jgi:hypothetical protein